MQGHIMIVTAVAGQCRILMCEWQQKPGIVLAHMCSQWATVQVLSKLQARVLVTEARFLPI